ncbi:MFS transporter [Paenibacillus arenilitoris]|uniref:MFS transporter n=1 Tax=Paenibacillus arenilitoris TaxID=2772299 RepID=A0A927CPP4_9BACL|nr:MFS transporter [Paenibacillus arenilitoris]MBD2871212.1 MFS transporter [Paenibacillus arenilitoris]
MNTISASQKMLFTVITVLYWTSMYVYVPTLSPYLSGRGLSLSFIGIVLGSYGFVQMLVRFPLGILSDRSGKRKPFIWLGMLTACLSCLLFLVPGSWVWPLAGRLMAGVCASTWVAFTVMYAGFFGAGQTGRAMGNISVMTVSGQMVGMLLSGWLTEGFSEDAPFILGAAIAATGLLLAMLLREPQGGRRDQPGMSLGMVKNVVRTRSLLQVSLLSILAHGVLFITMFGFTPLKAEELGASGSMLSVVVFAFMLPHAFASLVTARWFTPRFGYWGTIGAGFVLSAICTGAMAFADSIAVLALTQAINGFAQGLHMPLLLGLAIRDVELPARATAMGLYQALYAIGMFSGPFLAGWLNESWGLNGGFWFGTLLGAAAAALVWAWSRQERKTAVRSGKSKALAEEASL